MASDMYNFYPGGASNPHVELTTFEGGWCIEPTKDSFDKALGYIPEQHVPADDVIHSTAKPVGEVMLVHSLQDVYEI